MHCIFQHVPEIIEHAGKGLGVFSAQAFEAVHPDFLETYQRFKVDPEHKDYGKQFKASYVIMIPFMFVTTRTIFLHTSSVFSFRWNILQIICMQKMKCMYLTWNSSGVYLRPKNCNYSHRKILNELFGSWRKEIIRSMNHWLLFCKKTHFVLFRFGKLKFLDAKSSSFLVFGQRPNF